MTQFNLEWAKHGGVVTDDEHVWMWRCVDTSPLGINDELIVYLAGINTQTSNITSTVSSNLRMATSEECELAGIEYIDPPVSAEELRKNAERYMWLRNPDVDVGLVIDKRVGFVTPDDNVAGVGGHFDYEYRCGFELDFAIDNAMAAKGGV